MNTANLALPYIAASQAQKHVTHNEALRHLDALVHLSVLAAGLTSPPAAPAEGDRYIVASGSFGPWAGQSGRIAAYQDGAWMYYAPREGWLAWVADEGRIHAFKTGAWAPAGESVNPAPLIGVNSTATATNRLTVKSDAVLMSHDDMTPGTGDMRLVCNKAVPARTASVVFQSNYAGRAEMGISGDDDFRVKVSANGTAWTDALAVSAATGDVTMGGGAATASLHIRRANDPTLRLEETGSNSYAALAHRGSGQSVLEHVATAGQALIDLSPRALDGVSASFFRFFRDVSTTGPVRIDVHRGDGTFNVNHQLQGKSHSYLNKSDGFLKVGGGAASPNPVCMLDVDGPVRVKSYTATTLPVANAGAGQIIFVSNESGGAVLAFSDGSAWRRVTDRAVVS